MVRMAFQRFEYLLRRVIGENAVMKSCKYAIKYEVQMSVRPNYHTRNQAPFKPGLHCSCREPIFAFPASVLHPSNDSCDVLCLGLAELILGIVDRVVVPPNSLSSLLACRVCARHKNIIL